jgi:hypothetical protein
LKYWEGFWMLPYDIGDNHVLSDHGAHLVGLSALPNLKTAISTLTKIFLPHQKRDAGAVPPDRLPSVSVQTILAAQGLLDFGRYKAIDVAVK